VREAMIDELERDRALVVREGRHRLEEGGEVLAIAGLEAPLPDHEASGTTAGSTSGVLS